MVNMKDIDINHMIELNKNFSNDISKKALCNVYNKNSIDNVSMHHKTIDSLNHIFNVEVSKDPKPSDQGSSGRCWMFGGLNMLRRSVTRYLNMKDKFNFSHNYLFFWDKMERSNHFMELMIKYRKKDLKDIKVFERLE